MVKFTSFSSVQKQFSMHSAILKNHVIISPNFDWLIFLPTPRGKARKSRERADLANAGEFNRRYLTCQISAILYLDSGDWRKLQSPQRAHLVIASSVAKSLAKKFVVLVENQRQLCLQRNKNGRPLEIKRKTSLKGC